MNAVLCFCFGGKKKVLFTVNNSRNRIARSQLRHLVFEMPPLMALMAAKEQTHNELNGDSGVR